MSSGSHFVRAASFAVALASGVLLPSPSRADVVLLLAEPSGKGAGFNPTGHVAVYLTRVCAESLTAVRRCQPGEAGAVVSRYNGMAGLDWAATPVLPYLYAVERADDVPTFATRAEVAALRDEYRRRHLGALIRDGGEADAPTSRWTQLVGAAYDRRLIGFRVRTTPPQDDEIIAYLNRRPNRSRFNLLSRNCADFARDVVNQYFPGAIRTSALADFGITTPKQVSRTLVKYSAKRPELEPTTFVFPQIPGSHKASVRARGVSESFVRRKRYAIPLLVVQPWIPAGLTAGYLVSGRFDPERNATALDPMMLEAFARTASHTPDLGEQ